MAKKSCWDIEGQMDLFSYMAEMPTKEQKKAARNVLSEPISFADKKAKILSSAEEYLKKGERLTTLAKERFGEMVKLLTFSETEEKLYNIKVNDYDIKSSLVPKIATTVVRPLLKALTSFDENDEALKTLKALVDYDIDIRRVYVDGELAYMDRCGAVYKLKRKSDKLLKLTLKEEGFRNLEIYGFWLNAHPKRSKNVMFKDYSLMGDIAEIIAWLICFTQFNRAMVNDDLKPAIEKKLQNYQVDALLLLKKLIVKDTFEGKWADGYKDIRTLFEAKEAYFGIPLQKRRQPSESAVSEVCKILGYDEDKVVRDSNTSYESMIDRNRLEVADKDRPLMYVLTSDIDLAFLAIDPINWTRNVQKKLCYNRFLTPLMKEERYEQQNNPEFAPFVWPEPCNSLYGGATECVIRIMKQVLELVFENYKEKVNTLNYLKETKSRAKVYQTKKNIPEKVVKMMQESIFNDYFGYVEFDEDVDLDKINLIADEFIAFKESFLNKVDTQKVQIRFRKLGNYKAAGLYFPEIGCLCVDIRYPDSFVHEYGHCIDNTLGKNNRNLSDEAEFFNCYYAYKVAFSNAVYHSETAKDTLKGKYNDAYYLQKTEAFARCFEMYVTRTLGMQNNICKQDEKVSFAYPKDDALMEQINSYFDKLFEMLHEQNAEMAA